MCVQMHSMLQCCKSSDEEECPRSELGCLTEMDLWSFGRSTFSGAKLLCVVYFN